MKTLMTDIIAVLVFAVLARAAHGGLGLAQIADTFWPFAVGALVGTGIATVVLRGAGGWSPCSPAWRFGQRAMRRFPTFRSLLWRLLCPACCFSGGARLECWLPAVGPNPSPLYDALPAAKAGLACLGWPGLSPV